jgi:hypothetical protein
VILLAWIKAHLDVGCVALLAIVLWDLLGAIKKRLVHIQCVASFVVCARISFSTCNMQKIQDFQHTFKILLTKLEQNISVVAVVLNQYLKLVYFGVIYCISMTFSLCCCQIVPLSWSKISN